MATKRPNSTSNNNARKVPKGHWSQGLIVSMSDPELIVLEDELVVVINDTYPKAAAHYLVLPKKDIASLKQVTSEDLKLLKHMEDIGKTLQEKHSDKTLLLGYHAVPSMTRLHLHVISDDFDSPCLKTKKHWNSYTTEFFVPSEVIIEQLSSKGKISLMPADEAKKMINTPLKCHKCSYAPKHIPDLKHHIKVHM